MSAADSARVAATELLRTTLTRELSAAGLNRAARHLLHFRNLDLAPWRTLMDVLRTSSGQVPYDNNGMVAWLLVSASVDAAPFMVHYERDVARHVKPELQLWLKTPRTARVERMASFFLHADCPSREHHARLKAAFSIYLKQAEPQSSAASVAVVAKRALAAPDDGMASIPDSKRAAASSGSGSSSGAPVVKRAVASSSSAQNIKGAAATAAATTTAAASSSAPDTKRAAAVPLQAITSVRHLCRVCEDAPATVVAVPCGYQSICFACSNGLKATAISKKAAHCHCVRCQACVTTFVAVTLAGVEEPALAAASTVSATATTAAAASASSASLPPKTATNVRRPLRHVLIRTLTNQCFSIECVDTDTIDDIKTKIQDVSGIVSDQQRLIFRGQNLLDVLTLSYYNVADGDAFHMIQRLRGD